MDDEQGYPHDLGNLHLVIKSNVTCPQNKPFTLDLYFWVYWVYLGIPLFGMMCNDTQMAID